MVAEAARKREHRLIKNREAARECRRKKKEYIKVWLAKVFLLFSSSVLKIGSKCWRHRISSWLTNYRNLNGPILTVRGELMAINPKLRVLKLYWLFFMSFGILKYSPEFSRSPYAEQSPSSASHDTTGSPSSLSMIFRNKKFKEKKQLESRPILVRLGFLSFTYRLNL